MNLLIFRPADAQFRSPDHSSGELLIRGRQLTHVTDVHRVKSGDTLKVGLLNGLLGTAQVTEIGKDVARLDFVLDQPPPAALPVILIMALPRPKMLKRVLQTIATMGVKTLYLINSYRVEKSYWQTPFLSTEVIENELVLGLEQGVDTHLPLVHLRQRFKPFVEDELPGLLQNKRALLAHPDATASPCPQALSDGTILAVGPEGGFIAYEVNKLREAGFQTISLGARILRVETAVPVLLAKLF